MKIFTSCGYDVSTCIYEVAKSIDANPDLASQPFAVIGKTGAIFTDKIGDGWLEVGILKCHYEDPDGISDGILNEVDGLPGLKIS